MLAIELYSAIEREDGSDRNDVISTTYPHSYFRIVYNGQPLVMKGCTSALCDLNILLEALSFGEQGVPERCHMTASASMSKENDLTLTSKPNVWQTDDWLLIMVISSLLSTMVGAVVTWKMIENHQNRKLSYSEVPPYAL